jgi:hypothetical protein
VVGDGVVPADPVDEVVSPNDVVEALPVSSAQAANPRTMIAIPALPKSATATLRLIRRDIKWSSSSSRLKISQITLYACRGGCV